MRVENGQLSFEDYSGIVAEIERLTLQIRLWNRAYYDEDNPLVTDAEYDILQNRLRELERQYPQFVVKDTPTQKVGGQSKRSLNQVNHRHKMLSLQDVFSLAEVREFTARIREQDPNANFVVEQKIDGLSLSLRYLNGVFTQAITRGDGIIKGEDVSENAAQLLNLPLHLENAPEELEIRGEVYMPFSAFEKANERQEALGKKLFANPRNCAAGTLRQLNPALVRERGLSIIVFNVQFQKGLALNSHAESLDYLNSMGFTASPSYYRCCTDLEIEQAIESIGRQKDSLAYGLDGAVIKVDDLSLREKLGETAKTPRWAVAYKYPPEVRETELLDIQVQVGRSGRLTPLAILEPILLSGTMVSRATLHNQAIIESLDVRVGDIVRVHKSGEIIPAILSARRNPAHQDTKEFVMPQACPVCGAPVHPREGGVDLYCSGSDCPAQIEGKLIYFASRPAMDIAGLGEATVAALHQLDLIHSIADIYDLTKHRDFLIENGTIGRERKVDQLLESIEHSKNNEPERLLTGFGIPNVGKQAAISLCRAIPDLRDLAKSTEEELTQVSDIGPGTAQSLREFFEQEQSKALLLHLEAAGLKLVSSAKKHEQKTASLPLYGLKFVLTGSLSTLTRDDAEGKLTALGAEIGSSVSKKTDYLIYGASAGSKLEKARQIGIKLLDESEFIALLDEHREVSE